MSCTTKQVFSVTCENCPLFCTYNIILTKRYDKSILRGTTSQYREKQNDQKNQKFLLTHSEPWSPALWSVTLVTSAGH